MQILKINSKYFFSYVPKIVKDIKISSLKRFSETLEEVYFKLFSTAIITYWKTSGNSPPVHVVHNLKKCTNE